MTMPIIACFKTATFPARIFGGMNRTACQEGKFQGITARTDP
jgi:hypothetical protein